MDLKNFISKDSKPSPNKPAIKKADPAKPKVDAKPAPKVEPKKVEAKAKPVEKKIDPVKQKVDAKPAPKVEPKKVEAKAKPVEKKIDPVKPKVDAKPAPKVDAKPAPKFEPKKAEAKAKPVEKKIDPVKPKVDAKSTPKVEPKKAEAKVKPVEKKIDPVKPKVDAKPIPQKVDNKKSAPIKATPKSFKPVMKFEDFKAVSKEPNSRQDDYILKSESAKPLANQQKYFIKSFVDGYTPSANGVISSHMREYIGANAANILLGDRAPVAFLIKKNPKDDSSKVASKFITNFKNNKYFLNKHNAYELPDKCIIGCSLDINNEIQITNKPGTKKQISKNFQAIQDHEQVIFATGFIGQWDQHLANAGVKVDSDKAYAAIIDFDMAKIFSDDKLEYAPHSIYNKIYNLYFMYDREKFLNAIKKALQSKQKLIDLVAEAKDKEFSNNLLNKFKILEEEHKCFQLAKAFKNNQTKEANQLITKIDPKIIHKVSIQAIQEIADKIPKDVLSKGHAELFNKLNKHAFYKYAAVNADIKNGSDYTKSLKQITDYQNEFIDTILATAIMHGKEEFFHSKIINKLEASSKYNSLVTSIAFDQENIANTLISDIASIFTKKPTNYSPGLAYRDNKAITDYYEKSTSAYNKLLKSLVAAIDYGRDNYFESILNNIDEIKGDNFNKIFRKKLVDYDGDPYIDGDDLANTMHKATPKKLGYFKQAITHLKENHPNCKEWFYDKENCLRGKYKYSNYEEAFKTIFNKYLGDQPEYLNILLQTYPKQLNNQLKVKCRDLTEGYEPSNNPDMLALLDPYCSKLGFSGIAQLPLDQEDLV